MRTISFTQEGYKKLEQEKLTLIEKRKLAVAELSRAREMGDLSENGLYKAAKWELGGIDRRMRELTALLQYGKVVEKGSENVVGIGSTVVVDDGKKKQTFSIVGDYEGNPSEGKLSIISPIGKALLGKKLGDRVTIRTPSGLIEFTIVKIK